MNPNYPNVTLIETVAAALGPLMDRLVIVGGCAAGLPTAVRLGRCEPIVTRTKQNEG